MRANQYGKDVSPFFLENPHGVVVSLPKYLAEKFLSTKIGWKIAEPEDVPEQKAYPIDGDLTERGLKTRASIKKSRERKSIPDAAAQLDLDDLRAEGKKAGIKSYWMKSAEKLKNELAVLNK